MLEASPHVVAATRKKDLPKAQFHTIFHKPPYASESMKSEFPRPLGGSPPPEVPLLRAPLVAVVAQVQFASVLRIGQKEEIIPLQESLRRRYPIFLPETAQALRV